MIATESPSCPRNRGLLALGSVMIWPCVFVAGGIATDRALLQHISTPQASLVVEVDGNVDHVVMGSWRPCPLKTHNPTRMLSIRNVGDQVVYNPRVYTADGRNWHTLASIIGEFSRDGMSDEERAFALWQWCRTWIEDGPTFEGSLWGETRSMVRFLNTMGTGACGTYHIVMPILGRAAGLKTASGCLADCSHAVQRVYYGGRDRYLDAHIEHEEGQPRGWFALLLDQCEVAGVDDILADRYLIDRAGAGAGRWGYVMYFGPGASFHDMQESWDDPHTMAVDLRPGEGITWLWELAAPPWKMSEELYACGKHTSGWIDYAPQPEREDEQRDGVFFDKRYGGYTLAAGRDTGTVTWRVACPYPITGATASYRVKTPPGSSLDLWLSLDGIHYEQVETTEGEGDHRMNVRAPDWPGFHEPRLTHAVWFQAVLAGAPQAGPILFAPMLRAEFMAYRPSLPSLRAGRNEVRFACDNRETDQIAVEIEYAWRDMPTLPLPSAPRDPLAPSDGGVLPTHGALCWAPAAVWEGSIVDYEIVISSRADLAWPVISNTHRLTGAATPRFTLAAPDVLRPGGTYFWRVRARSDQGAWGPWSPTWSFVAQGPMPPVQVEADGEMLRWKAGEGGVPAIEFEVYGSCEHGFSPSKTAEVCYVHGATLERPATFIGAVQTPWFDLSARTEAFYRVIAVDDAGNRSTPSSIVAAPSPYLPPWSPPPATVGEVYRVSLPARLRRGRPTLSLREGIIIDGADAPTFRLHTAGEAAWLTLDATSGVLSATPGYEHAGKHAFTVTLQDGKGGNTEQVYILDVAP